MRQRLRQKHHIDSLFALLVFALFAGCILFVLLTGADVYSGLVARDEASYSRRTCASYLTARVRQAPATGAVSVGAFGDGDALVLTEDIGGDLYTTRVYCHEGWLCELFSAAGDALGPEAGERVLEAEGLALTLSDGLLTVTLTEGGQPVELILSVRGEGAAS